MKKGVNMCQNAIGNKGKYDLSPPKPETVPKPVVEEKKKKPPKIPKAKKPKKPKKPPKKASKPVVPKAVPKKPQVPNPIKPSDSEGLKELKEVLNNPPPEPKPAFFVPEDPVDKIIEEGMSDDDSVIVSKINHYCLTNTNGRVTNTMEGE